MENKVQHYGLETVLQRLLKAYPAFRKPIIEEADYWIGDKGEIYWTLLFGFLSRAVKEKIADNDYDNLEEMFDLMEEFGASEDEAVSTATLTSFMEALFNYSADYDPKYLECYLGPVSREYLIAWEEFNGLDPSWLKPK